MKEKVVFLDIDGVLNPFNRPELSGFQYTEEYRRILQDLAQVGIDDPFAPFLRRENIKELNDLLEQTGAKVVISSTWRILNTLPEIKTMFAYFGFRFNNRIIGTTPNLDAIRGTEISFWLDKHKEVGSFVILDDDSDMEPHLDRLVQTDPALGLTGEDVERARAILEEVV